MPVHKIRIGHVLARYADRTTALKNTITKAYQLEQKPGLFLGFTKTYHQTVDGTEIQPNQGQLLQHRVPEVAKGFLNDLGTLIDATATKDYGNASVTANVVVDGTTLVHNAPPTFLLSLQQQFTDLRTFVTNMPILPTDESWTWDAAQEQFVSEPSISTFARQVKEPLVLYPATDKHPAQTQLVENTHVIGTWTTTKFSGAISRADREKLLERINKVLDAIKAALHEANAHTTDEQTPSIELLGYVREGII